MHAGEGAIGEQALATARTTVEGIRKQNEQNFDSRAIGDDNSAEGIRK
jgi:hypothetical protein